MNILVLSSAVLLSYSGPSHLLSVAFKFEHLITCVIAGTLALNFILTVRSTTQLSIVHSVSTPQIRELDRVI